MQKPTATASVTVAVGFLLVMGEVLIAGAAQPDLPGVDVFVPEVALPGAGLGLQLAADNINGLAVFLLAVNKTPCGP